MAVNVTSQTIPLYNWTAGGDGVIRGDDKAGEYSNPPAAPSGFTVTYLSDTSLTLGWIDNSSVETLFRIEKSTDGISYSAFSTPAADTTTTTDTGLTVDTTYYYRIRAENASGNSDWVESYGTTTATGAPFTPLKSVSFNGVANGADVSSLVSFHGTLVNGYGTQGDTTIKFGANTSSANLSIESGTDGDSTNVYNNGNGMFGFHVTPPLTYANEDIWLYMRIYIPAGFSFATNIDHLKFLRFSPNASARLDFHIKQSAGVQTGWDIAVEDFPESSSKTGRTNTNIFNVGAWNSICLHVHVTNNTLDGSVHRLWVNDQFAMEHVGQAGVGIVTKWMNTTLQTDTWWPTQDGVFPIVEITDGTGWGTFKAPSTYLGNTLFWTYWNGYAPSDQSCNIQSIHFHKNAADLATDEYGNKFIHSTQVE